MIQTLECSSQLYVNVKFKTMAKKENKIMEELRRRGTIFEDPAPEVNGLADWLTELFSKKK